MSRPAASTTIGGVFVQMNKVTFLQLETITEPHMALMAQFSHPLTRSTPLTGPSCTTQLLRDAKVVLGSTDVTKKFVCDAD